MRPFEHYLEAERLLAKVEEPKNREAGWLRLTIAKAQVHATLAQMVEGPPPGHSCSCHAKNQGPCDHCRGFGCEVWDLNRYTSSVTYNPIKLTESETQLIEKLTDAGMDSGSSVEWVLEILRNRMG